MLTRWLFVENRRILLRMLGASAVVGILILCIDNYVSDIEKESAPMALERRKSAAIRRAFEKVTIRGLSSSTSSSRSPVRTEPTQEPDDDSLVADVLSGQSPDPILSILGGNDPKPRHCLTRSDILWSQTPSLLAQSSSMCPNLLEAAGNGSLDFDSDQISIDAKSWLPPRAHSAKSLLPLISDCAVFLRHAPFQTEPSTQEESDYPLAYVLVAHRNIGQTVRLFRMIYQPQNAYCITYDNKSDPDYIKTVLGLASCFPSNVYLTPKPEPIFYFGYSILRSVITCMEVLADSSVPWNYVQIVSWNDFPLRTNLEMVRIFKILNGSQDSELLKMDTPDYVTYVDGEHGSERRSIPPNGLIMYKGSFANSLSRAFVDFMLSDKLSQRFYEYLEDSKCAEEFYWPSLVHNIQLRAPGAFPGQCEIFYTNAAEKKPFLSRFQVWEWDKGDRKCKGKWISLSCVYGIDDLPMLLSRMELIAHKVYEEYEPALTYCMEEGFWDRTCRQRDEEPELDWEHYKQLPSVRYHHSSEEEKDRFVCEL